EKFYDDAGENTGLDFMRLDRARRAFREAVVTNVFNGEAYEGQATAYVNRAALGLQEILAEPEESTRTLAMRTMVERDSMAAIAVLNNQVASGGLRYHFTWYLLGRAWRMQWELEKEQVAPKDS